MKSHAGTQHSDKEWTKTLRMRQETRASSRYQLLGRLDEAGSYTHRSALSPLQCPPHQSNQWPHHPQMLVCFLVDFSLICSAGKQCAASFIVFFPPAAAHSRCSSFYSHMNIRMFLIWLHFYEPLLLLISAGTKITSLTPTFEPQCGAHFHRTW